MKKRLMKNKKRAILAGVCAGLGEYFNISPWIFRLLFVLPVLPFILTNMAGVISIVVYVLMAVFLPDKQRIEEQEVVEVDYEIIEDDHVDDEEVIDFSEGSPEGDKSSEKVKQEC